MTSSDEEDNQPLVRGAVEGKFKACCLTFSSWTGSGSFECMLYASLIHENGDGVAHLLDDSQTLFQDWVELFQKIFLAVLRFSLFIQNQHLISLDVQTPFAEHFAWLCEFNSG